MRKLVLTESNELAAVEVKEIWEGETFFLVDFCNRWERMFTLEPKIKNNLRALIVQVDFIDNRS